MTERFDVVVAGAGLTGATAALALAAAGLKVALVDAGASPDPRWSAVGAAAFRGWETLGVAGLREVSQPVWSMVVAEDAPPGAARLLAGSLQFDAEEGAAAPGEPLSWMVENAAALTALRTALATTDATVVAGRVAAVQAGGALAQVVLDDGRALAAALVVGAEGRRSTVREAAGIAIEGRAYRQQGVVATLRLSQPHEGAARQLFLATGPLAVLPLPGDRASLVWSIDSAAAAALLASPDAAFESLLSRRVGDGVGPVVLAGPRASFPLELRLAERMTAVRTALVGDAAHAIHPVAGQGLNLGLKDAFALADVVAEARRVGEDWGAEHVLDRYARWRRFDRAALAASADLFATRHPVARLARGVGLAATRASQGLRAGFMREAGGRGEDAPRAMRGLSS